MAKSIYEKFSDFKIRHNLSNELIAQIATEYANSSLELARTHFSEKYNISERAFYKVRDYSVIFCLVDDSICKKMREKSATNYSNNNDKNSSVAPLAHFDNLLDKRQEFLNRFSLNEIQDIGNKYAEGMSAENIARTYETGPLAINQLLKKGIIMLIFDSSTVNQIIANAKGNLKSILQKREKNKQLLLKCYLAETHSLKLQIENYDLYFRNYSNPPTMESLEGKLNNARKMYNETLQL